MTRKKVQRIAIERSIEFRADEMLNYPVGLDR